MEKFGFKENKCWVILNDRGCVVDVPTFKNNRRKSYFYSQRDNAPNEQSQFETKDMALKTLSKCKRQGRVALLKFDNADVSDCYDGQGANILGFDFINEKIWIESKDQSKYGYDYRSISLVEDDSEH